MSSMWGNQIKLSIFGESHGAGIGVVIDGLPAGIALDEGALHAFMARRAPGGRTQGSTKRKESDCPELLSGVYNGKTTGAPLAALIRNADARSADYEELASVARPGHADYTGFARYKGYQDTRSGGHFSGRLTAPLCLAGAVAAQVLAARQIFVGAHLRQVAKVFDRPFDPVALDRETLFAPGQRAFPVLDEEAGERMLEAIEQARMQQDSIGGVVECAAIGLPAGLGSPMCDGLENRIATLIFSIPAVKGVEFGAGFAAAEMRGSEHNDPFYIDGGKIVSRTNHAGGILGGISTGMPLVMRAAFKPTPSISREQSTVDYIRREQTVLSVRGRHDPCVAPRAVPVVEAAVCVALLDACLEAYGYRGYITE